MTDHHFVIFGASGGIGSELSRRLCRAGAKLTLAGRTASSLEKLAAELDTSFCQVDATSFDDVETCVSNAAETAGRLDGVVNCVGSILLKPAHLTTSNEWQETIDLNLKSAFAVVRAASKALRKDGGSMILVASAAGETGIANHEAIAAAKAGVAGLARSAAATYASRGIRVNAVAPGLVQTPMTEKIWGNPRSAETSRSMHPMGRLGEPSDIASLMFWLLQPENDWVTGQVFGVDGGLAQLRGFNRG